MMMVSLSHSGCASDSRFSRRPGVIASFKFVLETRNHWHTGPARAQPASEPGLSHGVPPWAAPGAVTPPVRVCIILGKRVSLSVIIMLISVGISTSEADMFSQ